jgi:hypothetical protein
MNIIRCQENIIFKKIEHINKTKILLNREMPNHQ